MNSSELKYTIRNCPYYTKSKNAKEILNTLTEYYNSNDSELCYNYFCINDEIRLILFGTNYLHWCSRTLQDILISELKACDTENKFPALKNLINGEDSYNKAEWDLYNAWSLEGIYGAAIVICGIGVLDEGFIEIKLNFENQQNEIMKLVAKAKRNLLEQLISKLKTDIIAFENSK